jgi:hypothetical protein
VTGPEVANAEKSSAGGGSQFADNVHYVNFWEVTRCPERVVRAMA